MHPWLVQAEGLLCSQSLFPGVFEQWSGNDGKVLDVCPEEVAEPHE